MQRLPFILAALLLLCGQFLLSQEDNSDDLKIDLLISRKATLQAKSDWLNSEQRILRAEIAAWEEYRENLQEEFNGKFRCSYDLDEKSCIPGTINGEEEQNAGSKEIP